MSTKMYTVCKLSKVSSMKLPQSGATLVMTLVAMVLTSLFITTAMSVLYLNLGKVIKNEKSQQAFNVAEAGINYYLWHMSHNNKDLTDNHPTATPITSGQYKDFYGPFEHTYYNADLQDTGKFDLYIKQKSDGSSIGVIRSVGISKNGYKRTLEAEIGGPSWSRYGLAAAVPLWFGNNETADGPTYSDIGIRMDGPSNSYVKSKRATYSGYSSLGASGSHPGVWCSSSVSTPVNCNTRDKSLWIYPDNSPPSFSTITSDLCSLKKTAFGDSPLTSGLLTSPNPCTEIPNTLTPAYIPRYANNINAQNGYLITLNSDGTYNRQRVDNEQYNGSTTKSYTQALSLSAPTNNIPVPDSKIIFVEDNVWVRTNPNFNGRVTIVAGRLASDSEKAKIIIADNLTYSTKNGSNVIGLVSENYVEVAPYAPSNQNSGAFNLEIDAAIIAKDGYVRVPSSYLGRGVPNWYNSNQTLTFYGSIVMGGTNANTNFWTWSYTSGDGYQHNSTSYDHNLLYAPPPSFPVTGSYNILKWREILATP